MLSSFNDFQNFLYHNFPISVTYLFSMCCMQTQVLWPESGWKPVPLVDIIESASVKRAYQKTMLYLHPDKLQQKGASLQQKYTAEKVFDILQVVIFNCVNSFDTTNYIVVCRNGCMKFRYFRQPTV